MSALLAKDRAVEAIHNAVAVAMEAGLSPKEFVQNAWVSWEQEIDDQKKSIGYQFKKMIQ